MKKPITEEESTLVLEEEEESEVHLGLEMGRIMGVKGNE